MNIMDLVYYWTVFAPIALFVTPRHICLKYKLIVLFLLGPFCWFTMMTIDGRTFLNNITDGVISRIKNKIHS